MKRPIDFLRLTTTIPYKLNLLRISPHNGALLLQGMLGRMVPGLLALRGGRAGPVRAPEELAAQRSAYNKARSAGSFGITNCAERENRASH